VCIYKFILFTFRQDLRFNSLQLPRINDLCEDNSVVKSVSVSIVVL
jgi:hypothetical protein